MLRGLLLIILIYPMAHGSEPLPDLKLTSKHMQAHNPLLPKLEPVLWKKLLEAEKNLKVTDKAESSKNDFLKIAAQLTKLHKLEKTENGISLGGITWNRVDNTVSIPAKVRYPNPSMPLETLLCQTKGRVHETLFITATRPLHLEVLLHMAGFRVGAKFQMTVKSSKESIALESFLRWKNKGSDLVLWKFTGSEFAEQYIPDNSGEQIIIWSRNEAVLEVENKDFSSLKVPLYSETVKSFPKDTQVDLVLEMSE